MEKVLKSLIFMLFCCHVNAQVGIGTTTPEASSMLDIDAKLSGDNKGVLIPRIPLTSTTDIVTISSPANSLLVYNTNTLNDITTGFYYWETDSNRWIRLLNSQSDDWARTGNSGTDSGVNFLGTTDNVDMVFKTNNSEVMRLQSGGEVAIGTSSVSGDNFVEVRTSVADIDGISSYASGTGGIGVYGSSPDYFGVWGVSTNSNGVVGSSMTDEGVRGVTSADEAVIGFLTAGVYGGNHSTGFSATGILGIANSATTSVGIRAIAGGTTSYQDAEVNSIGLTTNAPELAIYAYSENTTGERYSGHFVSEFDNDDNTYNEPRAQLAGFKPDGVGLIGNEMYYGGYFYSGGTLSGSYSYVGSRENTGTVGSPVWVNHKIIGNGVVSTIVKGENEDVTMFAPESPEVLFTDCGMGTLRNGETYIQLDPILTKNIHVSTSKPLRVFVQLEGECNGVYVTNKTSKGFLVKELKNGNSNINFSWYVLANRKDEIGKNNVLTSYQDLRFPIAPKRLMNQSISHKKVKDKKNTLNEMH